MTNITLKRAVLIAILTGMSSGAQALTSLDGEVPYPPHDPPLGTIPTTIPTSFTGTIPEGGQSFSDIFTFNFAGGNAGAHFHVMDIPTTMSPEVNFDGVLTGMSLFSAGANGVVGGNDDTLLASRSSFGTDSIDLVYNGPITGEAYITVSGVATGSAGAIFAGSIAPIPEPETYAMLLAGLGLMAAVVRRRVREES
jgi:PEP-CTERM motif